MNEKQMRALVGLSAAVGCAVLAHRLTKSYGAALGLPPSVATAIVSSAALVVARGLE